MLMAWRDDLTGPRAPTLDTGRNESDCQSGLVPDIVTTLKGAPVLDAPFFSAVERFKLNGKGG